MFFNGNSGLTAIAFNGLQAHCPALSPGLQGIYEAVFRKIPGKGIFEYLSDLLSIYCDRLAVVYCAAFPSDAYPGVLDLCTDKDGRTGILAIFLAER
jgi:hypothetical protein